MKVRITHTIELSYEQESIQRYLYQRDCDTNNVSFREYLQSYFIADGEFMMQRRAEQYLEECKHEDS